MNRVAKQGIAIHDAIGNTIENEKAIVRLDIGRKMSREKRAGKGNMRAAAGLRLEAVPPL